MDDAEQDYIWRRDPELATFDAARPFSGGRQGESFGQGLQA